MEELLQIPLSKMGSLLSILKYEDKVADYEIIDTEASKKEIPKQKKPETIEPKPTGKRTTRKKLADRG